MRPLSVHLDARRLWYAHHFRLSPASIRDARLSWGRLLEGAESYAKDLGQRYSPVRLMCSHPNGETWASRSGSIWVPLAARVLTTPPTFMVFQNMMMVASRFIPAMRYCWPSPDRSRISPRRWKLMARFRAWWASPLLWRVCALTL